MFDSFGKAEQLSWKVGITLVLPLAGYGIWLTEALFARPNPQWAFLLLVWTLGATLLAWGLTRGGAGRIFDRLDRHARSIAIGLMVIAAIVLIAVSVIQARYFAMSVYTEDTAYYSQVLWNTLHGDFLAGSVQQERLYNPPVSNDLALHVSPVLLVALLPIYALFPDFLTLLIIRDVALVAAAWPLFLLARERMGGTAGVAAMILYLANPVVIAQGFESFVLLHLAPLPFFWAFRAFVREEFGKFLFWMGIAISVREDIAIPMAGFGLWALVTGRQLQWWGVGLGIPVVWWGFTTLFVQPTFGRTLDVTLTGINQTPSGIYQILLGSPSWVLDGLRQGGLDYLYRQLRSVAFLGILGWEGLLAVPGLAATLLLAQVYPLAVDPFSRFSLLPSCALVGAAVVIVSRMGRKHRWELRGFAVIMFLLLPSVSLIDGVKDAVQGRVLSYAQGNDAAALWEAVELIPDTASVAAPTYALPSLSNRPKLFTLQYLHMYPQAQADYILFDRNLDRMTTNPKMRERYVALLDTLPRSTSYEIIWRQGEYFLLRRRGEESVPNSVGN
jgi:hypothetical protein